MHADLGALQSIILALLVQYLLLDYFLFLFRQTHDLHLLLQFIPRFFPLALLIFCLGVLVLDIGLGAGSFLASLARRLQFDISLSIGIGLCGLLLRLLLGTVRVSSVGPIGWVRRCDTLFLLLLHVLHSLSWSNMVVDNYDCTVFN